MCHLHVFFAKKSILIFCTFFNHSCFVIELYVLFICFRYESLKSHIICKCLLAFSRLSLSKILLAVQNLLHLIMSHLGLFVVVVVAFFFFLKESESISWSVVSDTL